MLRTACAAASGGLHRACAAGQRSLPWPIVLLLALLAGCTSLADRIDRQAQGAGFERSVATGMGYAHVVYANRLHAEADVVHVYIENDGLPWWGRYTAAADPTPERTVMLELMALDAAPAVYLGRPCYFGMARLPPCSPLDWTHERYAPRIVDSMAVALRRSLPAGGATHLVFVGHSGGGTLAVLLAERFPGTIAVITLAGNVDLRAWVRRHGYSPLDGSLDPATRPLLAPGVIQRHYVGTLDRNVTPDMLRGYAGHNPGAVVIGIDGLDHDCCWQSVWPQVLHDLRVELAR